MVSENNSVRYLKLLGATLLLASSINAANAADADILPPPPPDEDLPKPQTYDPGRYVQTYPIRKPGSATTTTTTIVPPEPVAPVTTTTSQTTTTTTTTGSATQPATTVQQSTTTTGNVSYRPANPAAQALLNQAYALMRKNDFAHAVNLLNSAVRADANSIIARRYLAYALIRVARPAEALNQLILLTNMLKPNLPTTFDNFNLGEAYLSLRNFGAAEDAFKSVVAREPRNDAARGDLIKAYAYQQKFPEAMMQLTIGQQNRDPRVQKYYRTLLELIYTAKAASTIGNAPNVTTVTETTNTWQQLSPK